MQLGCFIFSCLFLALYFTVVAIEHLQKSLDEMQQWLLRVLKISALLLAGGGLFFGVHSIENFTFAAIFESLYDAIKLFFADGTLYQNPKGQLLLGGNGLSLAYMLLYYLICGIAVYCTAAAVISLLKKFNTFKELLRRGRRKNLFLFSELSEKTLAIAQSISEADLDPDALAAEGLFFTRPLWELDKNRKKRSFIFCGVSEEAAALSYELLCGARKLEALCIKSDIAEVHQRLRNAKCYKNSEKRCFFYFLAREDQPENLRQALSIADAENKAGSDACRFKNLAVFCFATGEANGEIISALNQKGNQKNGFFVRRMNPAIMLAYNILADEQNYLVNEKDPDRDLQVLVAGMGQYGEELAKMLCWFYQRKAGGITIHMVDREEGIADRFRALYPALFQQGEARFSLFFHENTDLFSTAFSQLIQQGALKDLDAAFITLGDDDLNAEAALHLRKLLDQAHTLEDAPASDAAKIFAVIHDSKRCENFSKIPIPHIRFVGSDQKIYTFHNLYDPQKEQEAIFALMKKMETPSLDFAINSYNGQEDAHLSSLARAYYDCFYDKIYGEEKNSSERLPAERKRLDAYRRLGI